MNKKIALLLGVVCLVGVIIGATYLYDSLKDDVENEQLIVNDTNQSDESEGEEPSEEEATDSQSQKAPDFTVEDVEGNQVCLSDFKGKPVVLNFWASWCGPCKSEMPDFEEVYKEYGDEIVFMMVNLTDGSQETVETASAFIEGQGYTFPAYYDTNMEGAYAYGVSSVPRTYFIDADGNVAAWANGAISRDVIEEGMDRMK